MSNLPEEQSVSAEAAQPAVDETDRPATAAEAEVPGPRSASAAESTAGTPVLETRGLTAGYGSVTVVRDVNIKLDAGKVLAVLGPNGAGKTTLLSTMAGLLPRISGEVLVGGSPLANARPGAANRAGLVLVADDRALFTRLTIKENLEVAHRSGGLGVDDAMDMFPALKKRLKVAAGAVSGGEQQMLAVARALVQKPKVLLIDEMSMGLAPVIVEELLPVVRRIADETGAVVVLVEQHVHLALEVADAALVVVHGDVRLATSAKELATHPELLEAAYLGGDKAVSA